MKKFLLSLTLIVPLACLSLMSVGCSEPGEVKKGQPTAQANFGPSVGENELGEKGPEGTAFVN